MLLAENIVKEALERKSAVVLLACFSFILGIILHSFLNIKISFFWLYHLLLSIAVVIIFFWRQKKIRLLFWGVFFLIFGFGRFDFSILENKIFSQYFGKDVKITGVISDELINKIDKQQLIIKPERLGGKNFFGKERILITTNLYPARQYGDKISFYCRLKEPKVFSDFDYARWLSINNIYALCYWPEIQILSRKEGSQFLGAVFSAKNFLIEKINRTLHEPFASFLSGLLLGARNSIPSNLAENFRRTGTAHIIAISGWNITFLGRLFLPALFLFHLRRARAFYFMVAAIFLYAVFAGLSPSVVRAAMMGVIALYAQRTSRLNSAGRALLYGAALMFAINPRLVYDIGFWLSVSATFGLIYFSPFADKIFNKIPKGILREGLSTTVSAVIFTLPISSFAFGAVSLWALPANILILPFVAAAIILALPVLPLMIFLPGVAASQILFLPSVSALNFIVKVVNFFSSLPFGVWNVKINFFIMLAVYLILIIFTIKKVRASQETL